MKENKILSLKMVLLFISILLIYFISSPGVTPYNYFTRLAHSFVHGKLYINENISWLNELIPFNDKYFVALPPMPAILLSPFVFFDKSFSETTFAIILGSINVVLTFIMLKRLNFSDRTSYLVSIFFGLGTNHWFLASVGSSWYLAHIVALFFMLLALIETFSRERLLLIGFLIGASFWSRTTVVFTLPFFYIFLWRKFWPINIKNILSLHLGIIFFITLDGFYNFARFGSFNPLLPYRLIQGFDSNTVINGQYMGFSYILRHLDALFLELPRFIPKFPYFTPNLYSSALWFTSPAIIYIFKAKNSILRNACWLAILPTLFIVSLWAGVGFSQWGYRFAQDFMPFLIILMALGIGQKPSKLAYTLVILSIVINTWAVVMINKFNFWTM